ncbi:hypothetical protein B0H14DRAFT_2991425 [Mycena olivaceomarginata]|nr:hypothetical protein B0H14DRAFT_2991425 [Mycena olivaceomarginata]
MFNSKALLASILAALASFAAATPIGPSTDTEATVTVCSDGVPVRCAAVPLVSDICVNLTGGLSFLNKKISTATVFRDFGCTASGVVNAGTNSQVSLTGGTWHFNNVPGLSGPTNFNDLTSSFICSPI